VPTIVTETLAAGAATMVSNCGETPAGLVSPASVPADTSNRNVPLYGSSLVAG
jgi:hypothetical protein